MLKIYLPEKKMELLDPTVSYPAESIISQDLKSTKTTIPFIKENEFDYSWMVPFAKGEIRQVCGWIVFCPGFVFFIVTAVFKWGQSD